jgi:DNA-binding response OmpR family regulator
MNEKHIVLIADGDTTTCTRMSTELRRNGYDVVQARSGREALDMVRVARPDLVILDFMLPALDGIETARTLKDSYETRSIPLVLLTAEGNRELETLSQTDDSWWAARMEKPIDGDELVENVRSAIEASEKRHKTVPERIKDLFLERSRYRVDRIAGALREGRTKERLGAGIGSAVEYAAQLKGAALAFGYDKVAAIASEIEERLEVGNPEAIPGTPDVERLRIAVSELEDAEYEETGDGLDVDRDLASALQIVSGSNASASISRILFVHDDTALAERTQASAARHQARVTLAGNRPQALELAARRTFDAFVVAVRSEDGRLDMVAELAELVPGTPIVLRGGDDTEFCRKAVRAGATRMAPETADADELLQTATAARLTAQSHGNARILVLGGDAEVRRFAREQLHADIATVEFEPDDTDLMRDLARHEPDLLIVTLGPDAPETIERLEALRLSAARRLMPVVAITLPGIALMSSEIPAGITDASISLSEARDALAKIVCNLLDRARDRNEMFRIDTTTGALPREAFLRLVDDEISARREEGEAPLTIATLRLDYDGIASLAGRDAAEAAVGIAAAHLRSSLRVAGEMVGRLGPGCVAALRRTSDEERVRTQSRNALRAAQLGMAFGASIPSRTDCELRLGVAGCTPSAGVRQAVAESLRASEVIEARISGHGTRPIEGSVSLPRKSYPVQRHASFRRA